MVKFSGRAEASKKRRVGILLFARLCERLTDPPMTV
jgi:hypothetical protein